MLKSVIYLSALLWLAACGAATPRATNTATPTANAAPTRRSYVTALPTRSPFPTLAPEAELPPLTEAAMANCPVSLPNGKTPPSEAINSAGFDLGNEQGTLFTIPWPEGRVIFEPTGAGFRDADGSLSMKWPWYRSVPGEVVIGGRRLDAEAPPMPTITLRGVPDGYGEVGFHPSTLTWPSEGCWEVTARVGAERLTFVTLVIWLPNHDDP